MLTRGQKRKLEDADMDVCGTDKQVTQPCEGGAIKKRRRVKIVNWNEWVSATATRNHLMNDPFIDYAKYHDRLLATIPALRDAVTETQAKQSLATTFTTFVMAKGQEFETYVMRCLYGRFGEDLIVDIGGTGVRGSRSKRKAQETLGAMNRGIPIIYQGVLHNPTNQTYGTPDLIVRSDWINRIFRTPAVPTADITQPALKLKDIHDTSVAPRFHYRVIDIKFKTLSLRADGVHLLNSGSVAANKGQLWVYNEALAHIQGHNPGVAYLLGRKWTYTKKDERHAGSGPFDRLGTVDFNGIDKDYINKTKDAIQWVKDVRKFGRTWSITSVPLVRRELYPNMSNTQDYPWHSVKVKVAQTIDELTQLWRVGVKHRMHAHASGIYRWTDDQCDVDALDVRGENTRRVLQRILDINRGDALIAPSEIESNDQEWQAQQQIEFYVDFETISDVVMGDFGTDPINLIFMIGVGFVNPQTHGWNYREFTLRSMTLGEEYRICSEFSRFVHTESHLYECEEPLLVHWSNAEPAHWNAAFERHAYQRSGVEEWIEPNWFDLLKVFQKEPIVIKGCFGFSLKQIARKMYEYGWIETTWDDENPCADGMTAMVHAYYGYKESQARGASIRSIPAIKDIIDYNEVDCKVVAEIISYLREHHTFKER